jgi:hypothetical protein
MEKIIEKGYCQCGCGEKTKIAKNSDASRGWVKGEPIRFIFNHHMRGDLNPRKGKLREQSAHWRGGRSIDGNGYVRLYNPSHPRAHKCGRVQEHIVIAEEINGGPLSEGAVVHHIDGNKLNNSKDNLMICESKSYHRTLHCQQEKEKRECCS